MATFSRALVAGWGFPGRAASWAASFAPLLPQRSAEGSRSQRVNYFSSPGLKSHRLLLRQLYGRPAGSYIQAFFPVAEQMLAGKAARGKSPASCTPQAAPHFFVRLLTLGAVLRSFAQTTGTERKSYQRPRRTYSVISLFNGFEQYFNLNI